MKTGPRSAAVLTLVVLAHAGALAAAVLLQQQPEPPLELPVISGVIIEAPPAEVMEAPSARVAPPEPKPVEQPKPKPQPKPQPKPKPKPVPPPPVVPPPPSENAIATPPPPEPVQQQAAPPPPAPSTPQAEEKDTLGAPVQPPRIDAKQRNNPAPAYPPLSKRRGEEGVVILELLITAEGRVSDLKVSQSSGFPRLDQAALDAVERWRYEPARRNGVAIEYRYLQPVRFALDKK